MPDSAISLGFHHARMIFTAVLRHFVLRIATSALRCRRGCYGARAHDGRARRAHQYAVIFTIYHRRFSFIISVIRLFIARVLYEHSDAADYAF